MPDHAGARSTLTLDSEAGAAYGEDAFHYLVDVEWARARRSNQPVRLLFASVEPVPGQPQVLGTRRAASLFKGLRLTLRETDVVGWDRQGRVVGAVLSAQETDEGAGSDPDTIQQRVTGELHRCLPAKAARSLRVRVVELGPRPLRTD